ncbi:response regulator [Stackebrandtia nassauensis]|uniref:Two component transcriptional regulator, LuxR family n=1 Tax=Stackebrandtia nassauensis (strain DSM 44728 / CIP 108903 / NRRL B-16338 / NBRC 102104 / LLR-40K-21) TaxID=446470 RepID=D3Q6V9_STANL|nr:response regulator transcription factor [Stackebrandtia nassauensis]ADD40358.1 two component transcriptional regulator, LuxR family [Stackebrandtia nassauensis DSM 44728]
MIRVLLADDQVLMRGGFRALLDAEDDISVVAEAANGEEAVSLAAEHVPDVALIDIQMPGTGGIEAARRIAARPELASVRVVMLTNYGFDEYVYNALRAGASGFLVKDIEPAELLHAVRQAARGDAPLSPDVARRLMRDFASRPLSPNPVDDERLTNREREVVVLAAQGLNNEEIAERLVISPTTAKTHISRAMIKLACRDRTQLVVYAYESGLITPKQAS